MADMTVDVAEAVIAALVADAGVGALVNDRIYAGPPDNPTYPFVNLNNLTARDGALKGWDGQEIFLEFRSISESVSDLETLQIHAAMRNALDDKSFALTGGDEMVFCYHRLTDATWVGSDGRRNGISRYRVKALES